jgi:hypothetical protein
MTVTQSNDEKLERLMAKALRDMPARRAPRSLETRVLDELQRRATQVWWRQSFMHWPSTARAAFVVLNVALVAATFIGGVSNVIGGRSFDDFSGLLMSWMRPFVSVLSTMGGLTPVVLRAVPAGWLYAGVAVGVTLYVVLFGLGAAAYRTLYIRPSWAGDRS